MQKVIMPAELSAENGAKSLLIGEFFEEIEVPCHHCFGEDQIVQDLCEFCGGEGCLTVKVQVSWTNIKAIYAKAVKELARDLTKR